MQVAGTEKDAKIQREFVFEVSIVKQRAESSFRTRCHLLFPCDRFELPLDTVMTHKGESKEVFQSYCIYVKREDPATARYDGVEMVKEYRKKHEGIM